MIQRLREWERSARPIAALADVPFEGLGSELSRSVLVDPAQSLAGVGPIVDRLLAERPATSAAKLQVADAMNALACAGVQLPDVAHERITQWLPALIVVEPPLSGRIRAGLAALALGDVGRALHVAHVPHGAVYGGRTFTNDLLSLLGYVTSLVRAGGSVGALQNALHLVGEELDDLCRSGQLDEATVLWLARVAFQRLGTEPLGGVAARAHEWLWGTPKVLEAARQAPPEFPIGSTLAGGAYRVDRWLRGMGAQQLHLGVELATGAHLLLALDDYSARRQGTDGLVRSVAYHAPGIFELAHVGTFDADTDHRAIVEKVTAGEWLPRVLGPADPWTAPRKAIELGVSAGQILLGAAKAGIILAQIRPELMWAERVDGRHVVTGLSARAIELFRCARGDSFTQPLFEHWYRAPEAGADPDDRAVSFALAVMVAEWATGRYPLRSSYGAETAEHEPIEAPPKLRTLLERAIRPHRDDRPRLAELVADLAKLT